MADHCSICLVGAMDSLWFHRIIFSPEPTTLILPKTQKPSQTPLEVSPTCPSSSFSSSLSDDTEKFSDISPDASTDDCSNEEEEEKKTEYKKERPTRLNLIKDRVRSHSSSPTIHNQKLRLQKPSRQYSNIRSFEAVQLQRSMSCRSLEDLELEEVKGFMDLGFIFEEEHLSPKMVSLVPGLQRVRLQNNNNNGNNNEQQHSNRRDHELDVTSACGSGHGDSDKDGVSRPYLSDAWSIKRPDSPLLKLRMQRANDGAEMKKHIAFWAKIVASELVHQQEC